MITIFWILVTVAAATLTKGSFECDFSTSFTTQQQCFGELGQPLNFHLSNTTNTHIRLKKDETYLIIEINRYGKVRQFWKADEFEYLGNGTVKLNTSMRNHSGDYMMEEFQSNGKLMREVKAHVKILAPVSKPVLSQMCFSKEQAQVNCSSLGDEVRFILTLDGQPVRQTPVCSHCPSNWISEISNISSISIMSNELMSGNITCQVWNHVSKEESVVQLKPCKELSTSVPILVVAVIAAITLLLAVVWTLVIKGLDRGARPATAETWNSEEDIIYSEVRVISRRR